MRERIHRNSVDDDPGVCGESPRLVATDADDQGRTHMPEASAQDESAPQARVAERPVPEDTANFPVSPEHRRR